MSDYRKLTSVERQAAIAKLLDLAHECLANTQKLMLEAGGYKSVFDRLEAAKTICEQSQHGWK